MRCMTFQRSSRTRSNDWGLCSSILTESMLQRGRFYTDKNRYPRAPASWLRSNQQTGLEVQVDRILC